MVACKTGKEKNQKKMGNLDFVHTRHYINEVQNNKDNIGSDFKNKLENKK